MSESKLKMKIKKLQSVPSYSGLLTQEDPTNFLKRLPYLKTLIWQASKIFSTFRPVLWLEHDIIYFSASVLWSFSDS